LNRAPKTQRSLREIGYRSLLRHITGRAVSLFDQGLVKQPWQGCLTLDENTMYFRPRFDMALKNLGFLGFLKT